MGCLCLKQLKSRARGERRGGEAGGSHPRPPSAVQGGGSLHAPASCSVLNRSRHCPDKAAGGYIFMCVTHTYTVFIYRCPHTPKVAVPWRGLKSFGVSIRLLLLPYFMWSQVPSQFPFSSDKVICFVSAKINSTFISGAFGVYDWGGGRSVCWRWRGALLFAGTRAQPTMSVKRRSLAPSRWTATWITRPTSPPPCFADLG